MSHMHHNKQRPVSHSSVYPSIDVSNNHSIDIQPKTASEAVNLHI